ncbi:MAG: glycosyltransferase family 2 protein [Christensenella sp.]
MRLNKPTLAVVIPCYNEEAVLPLTSKLFLSEVLTLIAHEKIAENSYILFVDDGSNDNTWGLIKALAQQDDHFVGIALSRNRGHQNALLAGLMEARDRADISISIDCDGQDDCAAMEQMVDAYHDGFEIVYGVRSSRESDAFFKRVSAEGFYKILHLMGVDVVFNHADYRLLSKRVLDEFSHFTEVNLFLRGMIPLVGFRSTSVYYERHERIAGKSHYPLKKMFTLALDGMTSLSVKPIRLITSAGFVISILSFLGVIWAIVASVTGQSVAGWSSLLSVICFMGGIQMLSLGVIGEYVGKIYMETKHRPRFIIGETTYGNLDENEPDHCIR